MVAKAVSPEFIVNGITPGIQYRPVVTSLASGGFVIAWQDASGLGSADLSDDVRFARFDSFGARLTGAADTLANTTTPAAQFDPSIAAGSNGKFVIAWSDSSGTSPDFDNRAVRFQIFNEDGTKSGVEKIANTSFQLSQDEPSVTVLAGGNIVITWTAEIVSASSTTDIIRRVFDSAGNPLTGEQVVNTQILGDQDHSTTHALNSGGFAVVWQDREASAATGFQTKTFARFYNASGTASGAPIVINETSASDPIQPGFTELTNGKIVFTWTEPDFPAPGDGSGASVRYRIYDPALATFSATFRANTQTLNDQEDAQVAALDNGQFVIVWTDDDSTLGADTSFNKVKMQIFNAAGAKVGSEILVNSQFTFEQENASVAVLDDFRFVVTWQDNSQTGADPNGFSIRSRIYDARIAGINLSGDNTANNYVGSDFADTINGLGGSDTILGGLGADFIFGGSGFDSLSGGDGDDELYGGSNKDDCFGGAGNDTFKVIGADFGDNVYGGTGSDILDLSGWTSAVIAFVVSLAGQTYRFDPNSFGADGIYVLQGVENVRGSKNNDTIIGDALANILIGGGGDDVMSGGNGSDSFYVDSALDTVSEAAGALAGTLDTIFASVSYTSKINVERMYLTGTANINGTGVNGQNDIMYGNSGNNILNGLTGTDNMNGGLGDDQYYLNTSGDVVNEAAGAGFDTMFSQSSNTIALNVERLFLLNGGNYIANGRNGQNDFLSGNDGNNIINGFSGNDTIRGGLGNDTLTGGTGLDIFQFLTAPDTAANRDIITDFNAANDTIQLDNAVYTLLAATGVLAASLFKNLTLGAQDADDAFCMTRPTAISTTTITAWPRAASCTLPKSQMGWR